ncbi:calcium-binding protein [Actibacterium lipolyticum]|uniref:Bifunctional hemolysin/adenylate cyclase n=1 Tax=Actibacterium lipolyticum TaxID=1524263 RepID=A0A238KUD4_9RHOB|nr:calcium-binding protein [Actibacterium lipolyticum]SMX46409.1 Bifunctional hemolysin/adenylate cyclase precursor [Actibacterium lipolyticum]
MAYFAYQGTVVDDVLTTPFGVARLDGASGQLVLADSGGGQVVTFTLSEGSLAGVASTAYQHPLPGQDVTLILDNAVVTLAHADLAAVTAMAETESVTLFDNQSGEQADRIEALAVESGGQTFMFLSATDGAGVATFTVGGNGTIDAVSYATDDASHYAANITSMAHAKVAGVDYLIAASSTEDGVTCYRIMPDGNLAVTDAIGATEYLPIGAPQNIEVVELGGATFAILASATTSSLTVLRIEEDGTLMPVDQIMDDQTTRFANAAVLDSFTLNGQVYVLAAGSDDGLSLFTLLPDGRLLHVQTLVDSAQNSLRNVSEIAVQTVGDEVQLFVISAAEGGMSQFRFVPSAVQDEVLVSTGTLSGGAGADILIDGDGQDQLTGGSGADLFIFTPDGQADEIMDFQLGIDRLDLSALGMIHSVSSLTITPTADGAILQLGTEQIVLHSADGQPLEAADFTTADVVNVTRVSLAYDPLDELSSVEGSSANDQLIAGDGAQGLYGRSGDDLLTGGGGGDRLHGGDGFDFADYALATVGVIADLETPSANTGDAEGDVFVEVEGIIGSDFDDRLSGDDNANELRGGDGRDRLEGRGGDDILLGGDGNDEVLGHAGNDTLHGGNGNDNISSSDGDDTVYGDAGHDEIGGGNGNDTIYGGTGNDTIGSGNGDDFIDAGDGNDVTSGGYGADLEYGGNGDDTMAGSYGNDIVYGGAGNDSLGGGTGKDELYGGDGDDQIGAGSFDDKAWGGTGNDFIGGGDGDDELYGESGNDTLNGGVGFDVLTGGEGADIFVFNDFTDGEVDVITDFEDGIDAIRMKGIPGGFNSLSISGYSTFVELSYNDHVILIEGVSAHDIDVSDFIFV